MCIKNYPKPQITKLIGKERSIFEIVSDYKPEYKEFFHDKTWAFYAERASEDIKSLFTVEPNCYHASTRRLAFKIGENSELKKKLLKSHDCNIDNIDKWISENDNSVVAWLSLLKDGVTFYYDRINKE